MMRPDNHADTVSSEVAASQDEQVSSVRRENGTSRTLRILEQTFRPLAVPATTPRIPDRAGVYMLVDLEAIAYVGSSEQIDARVYAHSIDRSRSFDRALWVALPAKVHPDYEGAFIRALRPLGNLRAPRHRGHDAEILDGFGLSPSTDSAASRSPRDRGEVVRRIVAARKRLGLNVCAVAEQLGVCRQAVGHWESGRNTPGAALVESVAKLLELEVSDLLPSGEIQ